MSPCYWLRLLFLPWRLAVNGRRMATELAELYPEQP